MAKRVSLIDFQRALSERIAKAVTVTSASSRVGVRAGSRHWLLRLDQIAEINFVPQIDSIPLVRPWFHGLANLRGRMVGLVDMADFLGDGATVQSPDNRVVVLSDRFGFGAGLIVNRVMGLRDTAAMQLTMPTDADPDFVAGRYTDGEERQWGEIDLTRLVWTPEFLQLEASASTEA